jgi:RNA-binding protein PNO1
MPAPTALLRDPETLVEEEVSMQDVQDEGVLLDPSAEVEAEPLPTPTPTSAEDTSMEVDASGRPHFAPAKDTPTALRIETRKIPIPPHRYTPLKHNWTKIYTPLVEYLKLQCRVNVKNKTVELRTSKHTTSPGALQQGEDFVKAFTLGFDVDDAIALLRLDDLYIETFEVKDVK